jgi:hypothetical protein
VSVQSRVVKNEAAISALLKRYITLITHLAALRPIFIFRWSSSDPLCATQKVQNSSLAQIDVLSARLIEADERTVKASIYGLNRTDGRARGTGRSVDHSGSGA